MNGSIHLLCATLITALFNGAAAAAEIYRWVDGDGVVHYSDEKPRDDAAVTTIDIPDSRPADYDPHEDPYSIRNQAQRVNEAWTELAQARSEREQARRQAAQSAAAAPSSSYDSGQDYRTRYGYDRSWYYYPSPIFPRPAHPGAGRQQLRAINELGLTAPRPASINSGVHHDRVQRSAFLPIVPVAKPQRPRPR